MIHPAQGFEALVSEILKANSFEIIPNGLLMKPFDFIAKLANDTWAVEVKYYRTSRPQVELIEAAASQLLEAADAEQQAKAMLVVSCYLDPGLRHSLEEKFGAVFVDRVDLANWARTKPVLADELSRFLELPDLQSGQIRKPEDFQRQKLLAKALREWKPKHKGRDLCTKLKALKKGRSHWRDFERLCAEILKYLFDNSLNGWHEQKRTDDGLNRFDLICRVTPNTEFWKFIDYRLGSRYVLFEFKNYVGKIKQGQMLTTEKYLLQQGLRKVAFVICRKGADKGAKQVAVGAMRDVGKLMLVLDDEMLCQLLHAKDRGDDPGDILFEYTDDFLMSLSR